MSKMPCRISDIPGGFDPEYEVEISNSSHRLECEYNDELYERKENRDVESIGDTKK